MISAAGDPTQTRDLNRDGSVALAGNVASTKARSSRALRSTISRSSRATAAAVTSNGSFAYMTVNLALPRRATAAANFSARRDCSEKSTGHNNERNPHHLAGTKVSFQRSLLASG